MGGQSFDLSVCDMEQTGPVPILQYLSYDGIYLWSKQIYRTSQQEYAYKYVAAMALNEGLQRVAISLDKDTTKPLLIILISLIKGDIVVTCQELYTNSATVYEDMILPGTMSLNSVSSLYFGWLTYDRTSYVRLDLIKTLPANKISPAAYVIRVMDTADNCKGALALHRYGSGPGSPGKTLMSGKIKNGTQCSYSLINFDSATGDIEWGIWIIKYVSWFQRIEVNVAQSSTSLHTCGQFRMTSSGTTFGAFGRFEMNPSTYKPSWMDDADNVFLYSSGNQYSQECLAYMSKSSTQGYGMFRVKTSPSQHRLIKVNFAQKQTSGYDFDKYFDDASIQVNYAMFSKLVVPSTQYFLYFAGAFLKYNGGINQHGFSVQQGFVMKFPVFDSSQGQTQTYSKPDVCDNTYVLSQEVNYGEFVALDTSNFNLDLNYDLVAKLPAGSYNFAYNASKVALAFLNAGQTKFTYCRNYEISSNTLSSVTVQNQYTDLAMSRPSTLKYTIPEYTLVSAQCTATIWVFLSINDTATALSSFGWDWLSMELSWSATTPKGTYNVTIQGVIVTGQASNPQWFIIYIYDFCELASAVAVLSPTSAITYTLGAMPTSIMQDAFQLQGNRSACSLGYKLVDPSGITDSYVLELISIANTTDGSNKYTLQIGNALTQVDNTQIGSYTLQVVAYYKETIVKGSATLRITLQHQCKNQIITPTSLTEPLSYDISQTSPLQLPLTWTQSPLTSPPCPPIAYYTGAVDPQMFPFVAFDITYDNLGQATLYFSWTQSDLYGHSDITLNLMGELFDNSQLIDGPFAEMAYLIQLTDNICETTDLIDQSMVLTYSYVMNPNSGIKIQYPDITNGVAKCNQNINRMLTVESGGQDLDTSLYSFDPEKMMLTIQFFAPQLFKDQFTIVDATMTYQLMTASFVPVVKKVQITVENPCVTAKFLFPNGAQLDGEMTLFYTYNLQDPTMSIQVEPVVSSEPICGKVMRSFSLKDGSGADLTELGFIQGSVTSTGAFTFDVHSSNMALSSLSPITIQLMLKQPPYLEKTISIQVALTAICSQSSLTPSDFNAITSTLQLVQPDPASAPTVYQTKMFTYEVGAAGKMIVPIGFFKGNKECSGAGVSYKFSLLGGGQLPSYIKAEVGMQQITLTIQVLSRRQLANYYLIVLVEGQISNPDGSIVAAKVQIPVTFQVRQTAAPKFSPTLQDITLELGKTYEGNLPTITDDDFEDQGSVKSVNYGELEGAVTITYPKINIESKSLKKSGTYPITITLVDDNPSPMESDHTLNVILTDPPQPATKEETQKVQSQKALGNLSDFAISTFAGYQIPKGTEGSKYLQLDSKKFRAFIDSITQKGVVTIALTRPILVPSKGFQGYNQSTMRVVYDSKGETDSKDMLQNWTVTSVTRKAITLQLTFAYPLRVSSGYEYDQLAVKFLFNGMVISEDFLYALDSTPVLTSGIPPQFQDGSLANMLERTAQATSLVVTGALSSNILLAVFAGVSLKKLWMMISSLQIIVHYPMLKIPLPANFVNIMASVVEIVNLGLVPKQYIKELLSKVTSQSADDLSGNFKQMGYDSADPLQNMGLIFVVIILALVLAVSLVFARIFLKKFKIFQKVESAIQKKLFFNGFLRSYMKGYIKFNLSTFIAISAFASLSTGSKVFTVLYCAFLVSIPIAFYFLLTRTPADKLQSEEFEDKFGALTTDLNTSSRAALAYTPIYMVRRLLLAFTVVFLSSVPAIQAQMIILQSFGMLAFLVAYKPHDTPNSRAFEFFNEATILVVSYLTALNVELVTDDEMRSNVGWLVTGIIMLNVTANFVNIVIKLIQKLQQKVVALCEKLCKKKTQVDSKEIYEQVNDQRIHQYFKRDFHSPQKNPKAKGYKKKTKPKKDKGKARKENVAPVEIVCEIQPPQIENLNPDDPFEFVNVDHLKANYRPAVDQLTQVGARVPQNPADLLLEIEEPRHDYTIEELREIMLAQIKQQSQL